MGYSTDFEGRFELDKPLTPGLAAYLKEFNQTRRLKRRLDPKWGTEGEFYVDGSGFMGQGNKPNIVNHSESPSTQPGLWCKWTPSDDNKAIEWDGAEKFYNYIEWLGYLIANFLAPAGYTLNGIVTWAGEDRTDVGQIVVENNVVTVKEGRKRPVTASMPELRAELPVGVREWVQSYEQQARGFNPNEDGVYVVRVGGRVTIAKFDKRRDIFIILGREDHEQRDEFFASHSEVIRKLDVPEMSEEC